VRSASPDESAAIATIGDDAVLLVDPHAGSTARSLLEAVHRFEAADLLLRARLAARLGIGPTDLAAFRHLRRSAVAGRTVKVSDLQRHLGISNASASVVTTRLREAGLVEKSAGTDRRERILVLTAEGERLLDEAFGDSPQALDALLETVTTEESERIVALLDSVSGVLDRTTV
jgi:DNA-binding MarR family transcriptional regulator